MWTEIDSHPHIIREMERERERGRLTVTVEEKKSKRVAHTLTRRRHVFCQRSDLNGQTARIKRGLELQAFAQPECVPG